LTDKVTDDLRGEAHSAHRRAVYGPAEIVGRPRLPYIAAGTGLQRTHDEPGEGGQAEAVRVPLADGTLVKLPVAADSALIPSPLTLSYVFGTGYHAAVAGGVNERTKVTVIGDGAVGLLAVLSAKRLGAEQIVLMGRHQARTDLGREFGATDVVFARGEEGIAEVRELTGGNGTHVVLECVGNMPAYEQAVGILRPGGVISRVGVPQYEEAPIGFGSLFRHNLRLAGGPAPVRAYIEELMPDILDGTIEPGKVFDVTTGLDGVPAGYQGMADRKSLKVLIKPWPRGREKAKGGQNSPCHGRRW
jgi:threonine dehydrogenase-like Zn-dependent dehydrogenase